MPLVLDPRCRMLLLSSLIFAAANAELIMGTIAALNPCKGLNNTNFNATGSAIAPAFMINDTSKPANWTWHTGLQTTDKGQPEQYFWVDTTGSDNLNAANLSYQTCMQAWYELPDDLFKKPLNDTGDCHGMIGTTCLDALTKVIGGGGGRVCPAQLDYETPKECEGILTPENAISTGKTQKGQIADSFYFMLT